MRALLVTLTMPAAALVGMVPMDILDAAADLFSDLRVLFVGLGGLVAVVVVVIAAIKSAMSLAVIVRAAIVAVILMALVSGLLVTLAKQGEKDIKDRLDENAGPAITTTVASHARPLR